MTRRFLRSVCRALVGVVLLAQMSIAAYACPMLSPPSKVGPAAVSSAAGDAATTDCEGMAGAMDPSLPNLCAAHCHYGEQSDQASTLAVPAPGLTARYFSPPAPAPMVPSRPAAAGPSALAAAFPPHAILHCCFRI